MKNWSRIIALFLALQLSVLPASQAGMMTDGSQRIAHGFGPLATKTAALAASSWISHKPIWPIGPFMSGLVSRLLWSNDYATRAHAHEFFVGTISRRELSLERLRTFGVRIDHAWLFSTADLDMIVSAIEKFRHHTEAFQGVHMRWGRVKGKVAGHYTPYVGAADGKTGVITIGFQGYLAPHEFANILTHELGHAFYRFLLENRPEELLHIFSPLWKDENTPIPGAAFVSPYALTKMQESFCEIIRAYTVYPHQLNVLTAANYWYATTVRLEAFVFHEPLTTATPVLDENPERTLPGGAWTYMAFIPAALLSLVSAFGGLFLGLLTVSTVSLRIRYRKGALQWQPSATPVGWRDPALEILKTSDSHSKKNLWLLGAWTATALPLGVALVSPVIGILLWAVGLGLLQVGIELRRWKKERSLAAPHTKIHSSAAAASPASLDPTTPASRPTSHTAKPASPTLTKGWAITAITTLTLFLVSLGLVIYKTHPSQAIPFEALRTTEVGKILKEKWEKTQQQARELFNEWSLSPKTTPHRAVTKLVPKPPLANPEKKEHPDAGLESIETQNEEAPARVVSSDQMELHSTFFNIEPKFQYEQHMWDAFQLPTKFTLTKRTVEYSNTVLYIHLPPYRGDEIDKLVLQLGEEKTMLLSKRVEEGKEVYSFDEALHHDHTHPGLIWLYYQNGWWKEGDHWVTPPTFVDGKQKLVFVPRHPNSRLRVLSLILGVNDPRNQWPMPHFFPDFKNMKLYIYLKKAGHALNIMAPHLSPALSRTPVQLAA